MRQINFVLIFALCLALVLFSLENTELASIKIFKGIEIQAPLAIELLAAMGLGAILAWLFSIWTRLLKKLEYRQALRQMNSQEEHSQELEQNVESNKVEIEEQQKPLQSTSKAIKDEAVVA